MKTRISSKNYGVNPIHLTWTSTSAAEFQGYLDNSNVNAVLIENNLLISGNTRFAQIENNGFRVAAAGALTVANDKVLRVADNVNVIVNGTLKANNSSYLKGENVTVSGTGVVYVESANVEWTAKSGAWRGTWND